MAKSKLSKLVGSGMTTRKVDVYEPTAENIGFVLRKAAAEAAAFRTDPWGETSGKWVRSAHRVLAAGPEKGESDFLEPHAGRGWYAQKIIDLDADVRRQVGKGDMAMAVSMAAQWGFMVAEAEFKFFGDGDWKHGHAKRIAGDTNLSRFNIRRRNSRSAEWEKWNREAERIVRGNPAIASKARLAEIVKKNLGVRDKVSTIGKRLKVGTTS